MMKRYRHLKIIVLGISIALGGLLSYAFFSTESSVQHAIVKQGSVSIYPYEAKRDQESILEIFKNNWYMLSARDYSLEHIKWALDTGSPNEYEPRYFGKMHIATLYEGNEFAGFITYYMKNFNDGIVLFLGIGEKFRGKRYGQQLLDYATEQLKKMGAKTVSLVTRINNKSGIKLYTRAGFTQTQDIDPGFYNFKKQIQ